MGKEPLYPHTTKRQPGRVTGIEGSIEGEITTIEQEGGWAYSCIQIDEKDFANWLSERFGKPLTQDHNVAPYQKFPGRWRITVKRIS